MQNKTNLKNFYQELDKRFQEKDIKKTQQFLEDCVATAKEENDPEFIIAACNELGGICRVTGQIARAKELYETVTETLSQLGLIGTEHHATVLINAGDVRVTAEEWQAALYYFTQARKMLLELNLKDDYRMAALSNNISTVYARMGQFAEAERALDAAFQIIEKMPSCRGDLATTYVSLGELQVKQEKISAAKESFSKAAAIFEEAGGQDAHYWAALAGLGKVCHLEEDFDRAEEYYMQSLRCIERDYGKNPYHTTVTKALETVRREREKNE